MKRFAGARAATRIAMTLAAMSVLPVPASAQTILLLIRENVAGRPLPAPLPVREGLTASLFDAGIVVFDLPGAAPASGASEIMRLAQSAGADLILEVQADYTDTAAGGGLRISLHVSWSLLAGKTGVLIISGTRDAANSGRERDVDRPALGAEIAAPIAEEVRMALGAREPLR
jgi:hypothetical protein